MLKFKARGLSPAGVAAFAFLVVAANLAIYLGLIAGILLLIRWIFF